MSESKYYGVSTGDGNIGVSHLFPNFIVKTDKPWDLAEQVALSYFNDEYQQWAKDSMEVFGDEEYTISVVFYELPETQEQYAKAQEAFEKGESEDDPSLWDSPPAEFIVEVFPMGEKEPRECPVYSSIEEAL